MNKRSFLLVALVLFTVSLFAAPVVVTWEWMLEDPNVTTFRYQLDGENPDEWIVVDSSVTSYSVKGLDGSLAYTLYLQQSYDGENFSGSAQAISEPIFPVEPMDVVAEAEPVMEEAVVDAVMVADVEPVMEEAVADEVMVADAEPMVEDIVEPAVEEAKPVVAAEPVVAEVAPVVVAETPVADEKVKADSRFQTVITLGGGFNYAYAPFSTNVPAFSPYNLKAELGLQFKNIMTLNNTFGVGMDVGFAYTPYFSGSWGTAARTLFSNFSGILNDFTHTGTLSIGPMLNMQLGKVAVDIGGGGFVTYGSEFKSTESKEFMYGAFAKLALAYQFNNWFSMGLDAKYNFVLVDFANPTKFAEAGIFMGFSF